jgi:general secretion pathway protein J
VVLIQSIQEFHIHPRSQSGFTLIELIIAISLMGVIAVLSWRGMDGLGHTKAFTEQRMAQTAVMQTVLAQWQADLNAMQAVKGLSPAGLLWDGQVLRITRRSSALAADGSEAGLCVVAWTRRSAAQMGQGLGQWVRWQSRPSPDANRLREAWQQAARWSQNPSSEDLAQETVLLPLDQWQLVYFLGNAWINPLSSQFTQSFKHPDANTPTTLSQDEPPDAVRLIIELPPESGFGGRITLDWVSPVFTSTVM